MAYTRQEVALKGLVEQLNSDELLPALKPNLPGSPVSYRALTILAGAVVDFPVERNLTHIYKAEQLATARKWVSQQKMLNWKE